MSGLEGKTLQQIFEPLEQDQQDYLYYLLMGLNKGDARKLSSVHGNTVQAWLIDPEFASTSEHVLANKEKYIEEAPGVKKHFRMLKVEKFLDGLIDKGVGWIQGAETSGGDKALIMRAVELLAKVSERKPQASDYEDRLLKGGK